MDLLKAGKLLVQATEAIVNEVHEKTEPMFLKLQRMQEIYLNQNSALYSHSQIDKIEHHLESVKLKFVLADIHLEQLWALSMVSRSTNQPLVTFFLRPFFFRHDPSLIYFFGISVY
jgi:hypothetical protein